MLSSHKAYSCRPRWRSYCIANSRKTPKSLSSAWKLIKPTGPSNHNSSTRGSSKATQLPRRAPSNSNTFCSGSDTIAAHNWLQGFDDDVIAFRNGPIRIIANVGEDSVTLPVGETIVSSGFSMGTAPNTTVWALSAPDH